MEVETARRDAAALDPELLQLPELAPGVLRENSSIAEALYSQWLTLPETSKLVFLFLVLLACSSGSVIGLERFTHKFRVGVRSRVQTHEKHVCGFFLAVLL
jgi:hypothetical protein